MAVVCQWFGLKSTIMVSWFGPQNQGRQFSDLGLKIIPTASWFGSQNQVGWGFVDLCLKTDERMKTV
jgi:hypothetical protein